MPHNDPTTFTLWSYQTCQGNVASMGLKPDNFVAVIKLAQSILAFTPIVQSGNCVYTTQRREFCLLGRDKLLDNAIETLMLAHGCWQVTLP